MVKMFGERMQEPPGVCSLETRAASILLIGAIPCGGCAVAIQRVED